MNNVAQFENDRQQWCERCGQALDTDKLVWLELNTYTGIYSEPGTVPKDESQGCFTFGQACARSVIEAGGKNKKIFGRSIKHR